jgi:hypothetical protein
MKDNLASLQEHLGNRKGSQAEFRAWEVSHNAGLAPEFVLDVSNAPVQVRLVLGLTV